MAANIGPTPGGYFFPEPHSDVPLEKRELGQNMLNAAMVLHEQANYEALLPYREMYSIAYDWACTQRFDTPAASAFAHGWAVAKLYT